MVRSGISTSWRAKGDTSRNGGSSGGGSGGSGQGDSSGGPVPERQAPDAFPTLVIEAGYSQSLEQLRIKARFWFAISNHDIKIVLLAKLHPRQRTIVLERWEETQQGLPSTRWGSTWAPSCHQNITITEITANPPSYQVTSGDLVLGFRQLFLRDPQAGESDIVLSVTDLQGYARCIWGN
ncbi:hypothetical protein ACHAQJ_001291 [Trichoderma viride]